VVSLVVVAQVLLVLENLVAVLALEDVVVLVSLLVPLPGKKTQCRGSGSRRIRVFFWATQIRIHKYEVHGSGCGSGSFNHQAKIGRKTFIAPIL
jgi:hypothetical protein